MPSRTGTYWYDTVIVLVPRQSGKTTTDGDVADHRCLTQRRARVWLTQQTGNHAHNWMTLEHHDAIRESRVLSELGRCTAPAGAGQVYWNNKSLFKVFPPKPDALHSKQVDVVFWDEAWAFTREEGAELRQGARPGMVTRSGAQTWVTSTMGDDMSTWLQDFFDIGVASLDDPNSRIAFFHWGIPENGDAEDLELVAAHHPAYGFTVTMAALEAARREFKNDVSGWARAYGNRASRSRTAAFPPEMWQRCGAPQPEIPQHFGLSFDVKPGGDRAAVVAAWRDEDDNAWIEVLDERAGYEWVAPFVAEVALKHKVSVGYDTAGVHTLAVADILGRKYKRVKQRGLTTTEYTTSCATFAAEVRNGTLRHSRQKSLNEAVDCAVTRPILDGGWGWTRKISTGSIADIVAATVALRMYDDNSRKRSFKIHSVPA